MILQIIYIQFPLSYVLSIATLAVIIDNLHTSLASETDSEIRKVVRLDFNASVKTCCEYQSSFRNGKCQSSFDKSDGKLFPEVLQLPRGSLELYKANRDYKGLKCAKNYVNSVIKLNLSVLNIGIQTADSESILTERILIAGNQVYTQGEFCVDKISESELELTVCKQDRNETHIPLCCGSYHPKRFGRPGSCHSPKIQTSEQDENVDLDLSQLINMTDNLEDVGIVDEMGTKLDFKISRLPCIAQGSMFATRVGVTEDLVKVFENDTDVCFSSIIRGNDKGFYYELAYCGAEWPYEDFGLTPLEIHLYGISSIASLIFTLGGMGVYLTLRKYQSVHTWSQFCYVMALFAAYVTIVWGIYFPILPTDRCTSVSYFVLVNAYYFFGVQFITWLAILSFDLFLSFWRLKPNVGQKKGSFRRLYIYMMISWTCPIFSVGTAQFFKPPINNVKGLCAMTNPKLGELLGLLAVLLNIIFFIATFLLILKHRGNSQFASQNASKQQRKWFHLFGKLFLITGITFAGVTVEMLSKSVVNRSFLPLLVFRTIVCLQGVLVCVVYLCNKKTWNQLIKKYPRISGIGESISMRTFVTSRNATSTTTSTKSGAAIESRDSIEETRK